MQQVSSHQLLSEVAFTLTDTHYTAHSHQVIKGAFTVSPPLSFEKLYAINNDFNFQRGSVST